MAQAQRLADKVVLVTGGSAGIGLAIALRAADEGARVVLTGRDAARGRAAAERVGHDAVYVSHDATDESSWALLMQALRARHGRLDALVNNAGWLGSGAPQNPEQLALDEWHAVLRSNLDSVFLGCRAALELMRATGGSIVNVSSTAAILGTPAIAAYGAAKAGVRQYTKSVALYCARKGWAIRCNSVHPAVIETDMAEQIFRLYADDPAQARAAYLQRVPLGRTGEPEDVAQAVVYLASDEARYITGAELVIGGGLGV